MTYLLEGDEPKFHRLLRNRGVNIAMAVTFIGLFVGIPLIFWLMSVTIISVGKLFLLLFICGAIGLLKWRFVGEHVELEYHQYAMYSFAGFGLCLLNILLILNFTIKISEHKQVINYREFEFKSNRGDFEVDFENAALARNLTLFLHKHYKGIPHAEKLTITYSTGILGFDSVKDCKFE